ncbi:unnamed protein product [Urochloa humidicola]
MMTSVRRAALLLLPLVLVVAVRWLCCRCRRRRWYCLPSPVEKAGGELLPPVALYRRRREEQEQCCVCVFCLSGIEEGSEVRDLSCRHLFHRSCLDRWLVMARPLLATCPLCRRRLFLAAPAAAEEYGGDQDSDMDSDDMMLFMACVHTRSSWFWPS